MAKENQHRGVNHAVESATVQDHFDRWWGALALETNSLDPYCEHKELAWKAFAAAAELPANRQAEAARHAEYLEAMADVIPSSGRAGIVEACSVMRKAARFLKGANRAGREAPDALPAPEGLRSAVALLLSSLRKHRRWINGNLASDEISEINVAVTAANRALAKANGS